MNFTAYQMAYQLAELIELGHPHNGLVDLAELAASEFNDRNSSDLTDAALTAAAVRIHGVVFEREHRAA